MLTSWARSRSVSERAEPSADDKPQLSSSEDLEGQGSFELQPRLCPCSMLGQIATERVLAAILPAVRPQQGSRGAYQTPKNKSPADKTRLYGRAASECQAERGGASAPEGQNERLRKQVREPAWPKYGIKACSANGLQTIVYRTSRSFLSDTSDTSANMAQCGSSSVVSAADIQALAVAVSTMTNLAEEHTPQPAPPLATGGSSGSVPTAATA